VCAFSDPVIREIISSDAETTYQLAMQWGAIFCNLIPLTVVCVAIAIGLKMIPNAMIKGFIIFGRAIDYAARTILMISILEMFTGCFSMLFGGWGFEPLFAYDAEHLSQAGEVVGSIACMLAGAFPMVYLIKTYLAKPLAVIGRVLDLSEMAVAGILATAANALAMFPMVKDMRPEDKVKVAAFMVAGSFIIGDHLSFCATYQPTLIVPLMLGKLAAAIIAVVFTYFLALKKARELEAEDNAKLAAAKTEVETA
jgi:ethanolamine transporter